MINPFDAHAESYHKTSLCLSLYNGTKSKLLRTNARNLPTFLRQRYSKRGMRMLILIYIGTRESHIILRLMVETRDVYYCER